MINYKEIVNLQLNKYITYKDEKYLKSCMYNLFVAYLLEPNFTLVKDLKKLVYRAKKDIGYSEDIKIFEMLISFLEHKEIDTSYFDKNKFFYKNLYNKKNDKYYLLYLFFTSLNANVKGEKAKKVLEGYTKTDSIASLLIAFSYYIDKDYYNMYEYLHLSYIGGNNSVVLYIILGKYFNQDEITDKYNLFSKYIVWAINHKIDVNEIIYKHNKFIKINKNEDINLYFKIYTKQKNIDLLKIIVENYINKNQELTENIFELYKEAYIKQLNINNLNKMVLKGAIKFNYTKISYFAMKDFIKKENLSEDEKAFVYHLLVIRENLQDILLEYKDDIFKFGKNALSLDKEGFSYLSIYKYMLLSFYNSLSSKEIEKLEKLVFENLFKFKININNIENSKAKVLWVKNKEFDEGDTFFIKGNSIDIHSLTLNVTPIFFDFGKKNVINTKYTITPYVDGDNKDIIKYFYNKNMKSDFLVLSYVLTLIEEENYEDIEPFKEALKVNLSTYYKNIVNNIIGIHYFKKDNYINAIKYLENVEVVNKNLGKTLIKAYIDLDEYYKACEFLIRFYKDFNVQDTCDFLTILIEKEIDINLSEIGYYLVLENCSNDKILNYLVNNYKGSIIEYKSIFKSLNENINKEILCKKILHTYVDNKVLSKKTKDFNFFIKILHLVKDQVTLEKVSNYLSYEIIVNDLPFNKQLITLMEGLVINKKIKNLSVALCKAYVNTKTDNMEEVINIALSIMKRNNVVFPYFKEIPYCSNNKFINKCHSIIYFSNKQEELLLISNKEIFNMKHLGFGIYYYTFNCFYDETLKYKIVNVYGEVLKEKVYKNEKIFICESNDRYYKINNCIIYKKLHKFDLLEKELMWLNNEKDDDFLIM